MIVHRVIGKVKPGKRDEFMALQKKIIARYAELGVPPIKYYAVMVGAGSGDTLISEVGWESLSALEAGWSKLGPDPALNAIRSEQIDYVESRDSEILQVL